MTRKNVWEIVSKEAETIIKAIEKGEVKTCKEFRYYLERVYNWKIAGAIADIVNAYTYVNDIEMPYDKDNEEPAE